MVSSGIEVMFGTKSMKDLFGMISVAESGLLILAFCGYFVFLRVKPTYFGEFNNELKNDKFSSKLYNLLMIERVVVGIGLVMLLSTTFAGAIPIAAFVLIGIFVAIKRPYKARYNNIRQVANMAIATVVEVVYLFYKFTNVDTRNKDPMFFYLPFIVCCLLVGCVGYNGAAIVYSIVKFIK
jgi:hypothetical protein